MKRVLVLSSASIALAAACGGGGSTTGTGGASSSSATGLTVTSTATGSPTSTSTSGTGGGMPACSTEAWPTYGHDAQRTSATPGCIAGELTTKWRYAPAAPAMKMFQFVTHAVATKDAVYLGWSATDPPYTGTTAADRVSMDGARVWTFDSGTDSNLGHWPSVHFDKELLVNEDGLYFLDVATGMGIANPAGVDTWGESLSDSSRVYVVNVEHVDGPGIFVGAYDAAHKQVWQANTFGNCRIDAGDLAGGIALDGGTLFYAPSYSFGDGPKATFTSGLYAFDAATGTQAFYQATTPVSQISAGSGFVYLIETMNGMPALTARKQSDGTVAWQKPFMSAGSQAPVLAEGKVIVAHDFMAVTAYDAMSGAEAWTAMVSAQSTTGALVFSGGCVNNASSERDPTTTLAAALGSGTLIATAQDGVHVLSLADGSAKWSGMVPMAMGPVRDPVIVGSSLFVVDQGGLLRLDAK